MKLTKWLKEKWYKPVGFILSLALFMWSGIFKELSVANCFIGILSSFGIYEILEDINEIFVYRNNIKKGIIQCTITFKKDDDNEC